MALHIWSRYGEWNGRGFGGDNAQWEAWGGGVMTVDSCARADTAKAFLTTGGEPVRGCSIYRAGGLTRTLSASISA